MVQPACGIKRLLEKIGFPSTTQSAHFDNIKSEAKYRLGYFYTQNKITPRTRSPPKFRFHIKNKNLNYGRNKNVKKYYINNGKAVEISEEIHDYLTASDRQIRYCDKDRKKSDPEIDMKKEKVTEILSCKGSLNRLTNLGFDFADRFTGFQEAVTDKIMLEQALKKLSDKERFLITQLFILDKPSYILQRCLV